MLFYVFFHVFENLNFKIFFSMEKLLQLNSQIN